MSKFKMFNPESCVKDMLDGLKDAYPSLIVNSKLGLVALNEDRGNKVALVSGGGSGHEPFPAGFIASNMLTASVQGGVFYSPPPPNIYSLINFVSKYNKGGVLVIVLNYTGDNLNFGLATEHAKLKGIQIDTISIHDDCALLSSKRFSHIGRRGILGTMLAIKVLGALSDSGASLRGLVAEYRELQPRLASLGACLTPCRYPASDKPMFRLSQDHISLGLGIHGEPGAENIPICPFSKLIEKMITGLLRADIKKFGNKFCVLVANLGSCTQLSVFIFAQEVKRQLEAQELVVERMYAGTVMSSLDMNGYQISMLNTTGKRQWLDCLDATTSAFGWPGCQFSIYPDEPGPQLLPVPYYEDKPKYRGLMFNEKEAKIFRSCVILACVELKKNIEVLDDLDTNAGDGDCGTTIARFADGLLDAKDSLPWQDMSGALSEMARLAETKMGGCSGAIYSLLLQGAARSSTSWEAAWNGALETLHRYSPAVVGDRTLVDALAPACEAYSEHIAHKGKKNWEVALRLAVQQAKLGCSNTSNLKAKYGRASYCGAESFHDIDPGAYGVVIWLSAVAHGRDLDYHLLTFPLEKLLSGVSGGYQFVGVSVFEYMTMMVDCKCETEGPDKKAKLMENRDDIRLQNSVLKELSEIREYQEYTLQLIGGLKADMVKVQEAVKYTKWLANAAITEFTNKTDKPQETLKALNEKMNHYKEHSSAISCQFSALALFPYNAAKEDEISFKAHDVITDIEMNEGGWWTGSTNGKKGLFPSNYVILQ